MTFSVTIPAFKVRYLKECISSVLSQSYNDYEIIIVNDNSPEDIDTIVKSFDSPRIRYYKNKIGFGAEHVVDNWNKCLEYAQGDFIICMGDDDRLKTNFLADYVTLIKKYPDLDVFYSRTEIINERSEVIKTLEERPERESVYEMIFNRWNGGKMFIGDYLYRTEILRRQGGFFNLPYAWGSDAITAYQMAGQKGIANTKEVGFQYRVNNLTISKSTQNIKGKLDALRIERKWFESFFKQEPQNKKDNALWVWLKSHFDAHFDKMIAADIIHGIKENPKKESLKWLKQRKEYNLSRILILKCIAHGVLDF